MFGAQTPGGFQAASASMFSPATPQQPQQLGGKPGGIFGGGGGGAPAFGGGGMFGSAPQQNQAGGGGLFGNPQPQPPPPPQQQQQPGGSLFGGGQSGGGSLFGGGGGGFQQQQQPPGSGFGSAPGGQSLFGGGGGGQSLFGGSNQGGQSLFGGSNQGGGGLFGFSQQQPQQQGGNLFGGGGGGGGGLFGSSQPQQQQQGLFGRAPAFGAGSTFSGGFGQQQQQQQPGLFGGSNMNNNPASQDVQARIVAQTMAAPWWYRELIMVQSAYRPGQYCKFQALMYEVPSASPDLMGGEAAQVETAKAARKKLTMAMVPWLDARDWQRYEEKNPDPLNWMPCVVVGIEALYQRVSDQAANARSQLETFEDESSKDWLARAEDEARLLDEALDRCRQEHRRLSHRLAAALGRLERLEARGKPRLPDEIRFHERLERVRMAVDDSQGPRAKLAEIDAQLALGVKKQRNGDAQPPSDPPIDLLGFLEVQVESISQLVKVALKDAHDVALITRNLKGN